MTNEEIKKEILHRVAVQKKKRQRILRVSASLGAVVLVSLAGVGLMGSGVFDQTPPVTDTVVQTTTTVDIPTEGEDTTTSAATETTAVTTVTTTAPTQTETTYPQTQASIKGPHYRPTTRPTQTASTTSASKTTQTTQTTPSTQPTVSQTKPTATQTKPTQTTPTTQPTVPSVEDDYIVVETPVGSEPGNPYMISAKIPTQCNASDEYVPISLSYGVVIAGPVKDQPLNSYMVLYLQNDEENIAILKRIDRQLFLTEYSIEILWDEDRMWAIDYIYSHTETILFPLSLCSKDSGRIWIALNKETEEGERGIEVKKHVTSICFDYVRSGTNITFSIVA